ncbi:MAG: hypothetical protein JWP96_1297 [Polaromonas sp.]|nr:hypothetical protein [Polaromonas sp.]
MRLSFALFFAASFCMATAMAQEAPTLEIVWPPAEATVPLGLDAEGAIGVVVKSNYRLLAAGQCGADTRCGHIHLKIDPQGDTCNLPGRPYNSMNSDFGGDLIKARFGACTSPTGPHVIGILLADDHHQPILVNGKPVTQLLRLTTR